MKELYVMVLMMMQVTVQPDGTAIAEKHDAQAYLVSTFTECLERQLEGNKELRRQHPEAYAHGWMRVQCVAVSAE